MRAVRRLVRRFGWNRLELEETWGCDSWFVGPRRGSARASCGAEAWRGRAEARRTAAMASGRGEIGGGRRTGEALGNRKTRGEEEE